MGRAGFEPATFRLSVERSSRAELPARALGDTSLILCCFIRIFVNALMQHNNCVVRSVWARSLARHSFRVVTSPSSFLPAKRNPLPFSFFAQPSKLLIIGYILAAGGLSLDSAKQMFKATCSRCGAVGKMSFQHSRCRRVLCNQRLGDRHYNRQVWRELNVYVGKNGTSSPIFSLFTLILGRLGKRLG